MKRPTLLVLTTMAAALVLTGGVALAASISCPTGAGNLCVGTNRADSLTGTLRKDDLQAGGGNDTVRARAGNDRLEGGRGDDTIKGGMGDDTFVFTARWERDILNDSSGAGTLDFSALASGVFVKLVSSTDLEVSSGPNTVNWPSNVLVERVLGGSGGDFVEANEAKNVLLGKGGGDELAGMGGGDTLFGSEGFDALRGGPGDDDLNGGADGDTYFFAGGWGADVVVDPAGFDSLDFSFIRTPMVVDLSPTTSSPEARSGTNTVNLEQRIVLEQAQGGFADDSLSGNHVGNALEGDEGDDTIDGRAGADGLGGGRGNDEITGGPGRDVIVSRSGDDTVHAADGEIDEISCGTGADTVYLDEGLDDVAGNCESLIPSTQP